MGVIYILDSCLSPCVHLLADPTTKTFPLVSRPDFSMGCATSSRVPVPTRTTLTSLTFDDGHDESVGMKDVLGISYLLRKSRQLSPTHVRDRMVSQRSCRSAWNGPGNNFSEFLSNDS